jgi:hypothetical protein
MRRWFGVTATALVLAGTTASAQEPVSMRVPAPELRGVTEWVNTKPLELAKLKGRVVVLHFWAFG